MRVAASRPVVRSLTAVPGCILAVCSFFLAVPWADWGCLSLCELSFTFLYLLVFRYPFQDVAAMKWFDSSEGMPISTEEKGISAEEKRISSEEKRISTEENARSSSKYKVRYVEIVVVVVWGPTTMTKTIVSISSFRWFCLYVFVVLGPPFRMTGSDWHDSFTGVPVGAAMSKGHLQSATVSEAAVDARSGTGLRICFLLWFPFRFSKERGRVRQYPSR